MRSCPIYTGKGHCPGPLMRCALPGRENQLTSQKWVPLLGHQITSLSVLRVHILALPFPAIFPLVNCLASYNLSFLFCKMGYSTIIFRSSLWFMRITSDDAIPDSNHSRNVTHCYPRCQVMVLVLPTAYKMGTLQSRNKELPKENTQNGKSPQHVLALWAVALSWSNAGLTRR